MKPTSAVLLGLCAACSAPPHAPVTSPSSSSAPSAEPPPTAEPVSPPPAATAQERVAPTAEPSLPSVLQDYEHVEIANLHVDPGVAESSIEADASAEGGRVLRVRYHCPPEDPPGCDIWQQLGGADWRGARAVLFRIRTDGSLTFSTSFIDGNGVGYTTRTDATRGGQWETLRVPIERYEPNRYFQPPDAKVGSPLDLGHVRAFGFCPLGEGPGTFAVDEISLER